MTEGGPNGGDVVVFLIKMDEKTGDEVEIINSITPISIKAVRDFYNVVSLYDKQEVIINQRAPELDELFSEDKNVLSLHGFKVDKDHAEGWHSEFFKRLHQSQSSARFWGISWDGAQRDGNDNPGKYYHRDAAHAFTTAIGLNHFVEQMRGCGILKGQVSVMAHSLGNMVASSAIALRKMKVANYFMLDAAVPVEAYVGESDDDLMINNAWKKYPKESFCSKWYKLFSEAADIVTDGDAEEDERKNLKWPSLFDKMECKVYNYYSKGDEVFELSKYVWALAGMDLPKKGFDLSQYVWQKQEVWKGWDEVYNVLVDKNPNMGIPGISGGWGFHKAKKWFISYIAYSAKEAAKAAPDSLRRCPVFAHTPEYAYEWDKYDNDKTHSYKTALLCHVIPAMSPAAGNSVCEGFDNQDLESLRNGWGRQDRFYKDRWLHCDVKDMAYFYNCTMWDNIVEKGNFKRNKSK